MYKCVNKILLDVAFGATDLELGQPDTHIGPKRIIKIIHIQLYNVL